MSLADGNRQEFVRYYDELISRPVMRRLYGGAPYYNVGEWSESPANQAEACDRLMALILDALPGTCHRILDVGCGLGAGTRRVAEHFPRARVQGINLSASQARQASRHCPQARFCAMDAVRLAFADQSFSAITSVEAAFHFSPRTGFFAEAYRVLENGGRLVLTDMLFFDDDWIGAESVSTKNRVADLDEYRQQCQAAGFEVVQLEDVTETTWKGYYRHLGHWAKDLSDPVDRSRLSWLANHLVDVPAAYLLAVLRRPS